MKVDPTPAPLADNNGMRRAVVPSALYPLRFEPIYQYRLWGGRELAHVLEAPLPSGPIGEAWILSDRDEHASRVAAGPLQGWTLRQVLAHYPEQVLGALAGHFDRFPLLLKFLDARQMLSVQVHPSDAHPELLPPGESGKTEAWVVLAAEAQSRIYAGLTPGTTEATLRQALERGELTECLASFTPQPGDAVLLPAGTVHSLGDGVVVFEIQQNSDVTFRLFDWNHVDKATGQARPLQVEPALACIDFASGPVAPVTPPVDATTEARARLLHCKYFSVWRVCAQTAFTVGAAGVVRVLVCIEGAGEIEHGAASYAVRRGDVVVLPAALGPCAFRPSAAVTLLEIALPHDQASAHKADQERP